MPDSRCKACVVDSFRYIRAKDKKGLERDGLFA